MSAPRRAAWAAGFLLVVGAARAAPIEACGDQAARYENSKGFKLSVIRAGEVRIVNPLRPLTPEVTQVLEVIIGAKRATAYGPDFSTLRRGGAPRAMQAALGAPITWEAKLPPLPETLGIVADDGAPLAELTFRLCEAPPAAAPEPVPTPQAARKGTKPRSGGGKTAASAGAGTAAENAAPEPSPTKGRAKPAPKAAPKTPTGFSLPQGAIGE